MQKRRQRFSLTATASSEFVRVYRTYPAPDSWWSSILLGLHGCSLESPRYNNTTRKKNLNEAEFLTLESVPSLRFTPVHPHPRAAICLTIQAIVAAVSLTVVVVHTSKPTGRGRFAARSMSASRSGLLYPVASSHVRTIYDGRTLFSSKAMKPLLDENGGAVVPQTTPIGRPIVLPRISGGAARGAANKKVIPVVSEDPIVPLAFKSSTW